MRYEVEEDMVRAVRAFCEAYASIRADLLAERWTSRDLRDEAARLKQRINELEGDLIDAECKIRELRGEADG